MQPERLVNGVKRRLDGKGDAWANAHRETLGQTFNMHDVDALFGAMAFGHNTGERLFLEYVPDDYENRGKVIREFGLVAMFDRKTSRQFAFSEKNRLSLSYYLWMCRGLAVRESLRPRFFFVIGGQEPPWHMVEMDIDSGEPTGSESVIEGVDAADWRTLWRALGLADLRNSVRKVVDHSYARPRPVSPLQFKCPF